MIFVSAFLTGILLVVVSSILIKTPEEEANEFIEELKAGSIKAESLSDDKQEELDKFIKFPEVKGLDQTRMVIDTAENVDNGYEVRARFQAYEYKDEGSQVIESYDGDLYITMKKVGFREWDIIDVRINPYE